MKSNHHGEVTHLTSSQGDLYADAYVLNLGAYARPSVLQHTPAADKTSGVAGRWLL